MVSNKQLNSTNHNHNNTSSSSTSTTNNSSCGKEQIKFAFKEGERVLCYEPDPNKARVLYDSKILGCRTSKSKKTTPEYLVHFYGWNSSWDRCVSEEHILKNTPEGKELQRQLAVEAAQGIKKWKKVKLNKIPAIIKEVVFNNSNSQDGSESGFKDNNDDSSVDVMSQESSSQSSSSSDHITTLPTPTTSCTLTETVGSMSEPLVWLPFPDSFKAILDKDSDRMGCKEWYDLPMKVTVTDILKGFTETVEKGEVADLLPNYTRRSGVTRAFTQTNSRSFSDLQQLIDEFTNSFSIYFNSICTSHLFYSEEEKESFTKKSNGKNPCDTLGFVHLLRFLVVLPDFVQATVTMSKKQVGLLMSILDNFYFFLKKRTDKYNITSKNCDS